MNLSNLGLACQGIQEELKPNGKSAQRAAGFKSESTGSEMTPSVGKPVAMAKIWRREEINMAAHMR